MTMTLYVAEECRWANSELSKATKILSELSYCNITMCEDLDLEVEVIRKCHEMLLHVNNNLYAKSRARMDMEE